MALSDKQKQKRADAIAPYLEPGETVQESFLGQTPVPPWVFFLIAPYVFIFMQKYRTVAATDRNVYVMHNSFLRSYKFDKVAHKAPLSAAQIESGGTWVKIDDGPKLLVPPFGPIKRGLTELLAYVRGTGAAPPEAAPSPESPPAT
jgi:hypothetical protein